MVRRYDEAEVAEILDRASSGGPHPLETRPEDGLTLPEIQDIGEEVGIRRDDITAAARALDHSTDRGSPLAQLREQARMTHVVTLPEVPSESEWDRMVVALRGVFGGVGAVERSGSLRSWTGDGVEVHGEPVDAGYRLRIDARNPDAFQNITGGAASILVGVVMAGLLAITGTADAVTLGASGLIVAVGAAWGAYGRWALSRWRQLMSARLSDATDALRLPAGDSR